MQINDVLGAQMVHGMRIGDLGDDGVVADLRLDIAFTSTTVNGVPCSPGGKSAGDCCCRRISCC